MAVLPFDRESGNAPTGREIETLIALLAKLPGLGPRSARRVALQLIKKREGLLVPLAQALAEAARSVRPCSVCGNVDTVDPCGLCKDQRRDNGLLCVIEEVGDLWALERAQVFAGRYHVLGGTLSALDGIGPDNLALAPLITRVAEGQIREVVLAMNATVDGQATAHYVAERLAPFGVRVSRLAHGVPVGGELDYLDDGTLEAAFRARRSL
jgi:recombination protein RecR